MSETNQNQLATSIDTHALAGVDFGAFAGMGFEGQTQRDVSIPFLGLLQAGSPQVTDGDPKRIPGAVAGDLLNTVTQQLLGRTVYVVPCLTQNVFVEWAPRDSGDGFQGVHAIDSPVVAGARSVAKSFNDLKTPEGNELGETFYVYGLLLERSDSKESTCPVVIAFNSSKIKIYKRFNTMVRMIKGNPPLCAFRLAVTSFDDKDKKNHNFKNFKIDFAGGSLANSVNLPTNEYKGLLDEGKRFVEAVKGGLVRAAYDTQTTEPKTDGDEPF
jgi:hypothetical protein